MALETAAIISAQIAIAVPTLLGLFAAAQQVREVWKQYVQKRYEVSRHTYELYARYGTVARQIRLNPLAVSPIE